MTQKQRNAVEKLGFTSNLWNRPNYNKIKFVIFENLPEEEQQKAARDLGYQEGEEVPVILESTSNL